MKIITLPNGKYAVRLGWPFRFLYVDLDEPKWEWSGTSHYFNSSCCGTLEQCEMAMIRRGKFAIPGKI